jgi:hypothetical protein
MKYYVRKEFSPVYGKMVWRSYADKDCTSLMKTEEAEEKLHETMKNVIKSPDEFIGEFDTDNNGLICGQCGEPTKDSEKCGECKSAEAEHGMEMDR